MTPWVSMQYVADDSLSMSCYYRGLFVEIYLLGYRIVVTGLLVFVE